MIKVCVTPQDGVEICTTIDTDHDAATRAYTTTLGDGTTTVFPVVHNLDANELVPVVRDTATGAIGGVTPTLTVVDQNNATLAFPTAPTAGQYKVTLLGVTPA